MSEFKPTLVWGPGSQLLGCELENPVLRLSNGQLAKDAAKETRSVVRKCGKAPLAPLPANKNDIIEWRELVYGRDGIVGDIIAQEALIEDADLFDVPHSQTKANPHHDEPDSPHEAHHAWNHTKAVIKAGAFDKGGSMYVERATVHLDTNVDPSRMSNFARQEFIEEVAAELGVEPSQVKLRT